MMHTFKFADVILLLSFFVRDRLVEKAKKLVLETNTAMCELHDVELDSTSKRIKTRDKLAKEFGEILVGYRETMWYTKLHIHYL